MSRAGRKEPHGGKQLAAARSYNKSRLQQLGQLTTAFHLALRQVGNGFSLRTVGKQ
jgi:hypothetical protein